MRETFPPKFEGQIPKGNYGAGKVEIWDRGTFEAEGGLSAGEQVRRGEIKFRLHGQRLQGTYVLVKMRNSRRDTEWLFLKHAERNQQAPPKFRKKPWQVRPQTQSCRGWGI
jgi:DNA ligase D-like protein (predicted 3'-phosphoesterase)